MPYPSSLFFAAVTSTSSAPATTSPKLGQAIGIALLGVLLGVWFTQQRPLLHPQMPQDTGVTGNLTLFGNQGAFLHHILTPGAKAQVPMVAVASNAAGVPAAPSTADAPSGKAAPALEPGIHITRPLWQDLTESQQSILQGLQASWPYMSNAEKRRWLATAKKIRQLEQPTRERVISRLAGWNQMDELQRAKLRQAFLNHEAELADVGHDAWLAYSQLSEKERLLWQRKTEAAAAPAAAKPRNKRPRQRLVRIPAAKPSAKLANLPKIPLEATGSAVTHVRAKEAPAEPPATQRRRLTITPAEPLPPVYQN